MVTDTKTINLAELSDDEINNLDPTSLPDDKVVEDQGPKLSEEEVEELKRKEEEALKAEEEKNASKLDDDQAGDKSADGDSDKNDDSDDSDGTDPENDSKNDDDDGADKTSVNEGDKSGNDDDDSDESGEKSKDDQSSEKDPDKDEASKVSDKVDFEVELKKVLAPFKAAGREITVDSPEKARRLMQMGVDYSRKMEAMKPYQRILKTLERNGLLDEDKVNFMIDLDKKNPEAIKKFLKDSEIDPMDLDLKEDSKYKPTDHMVGDKELNLDAVLDDIRDTETFDRTVDVITNQWDTASKRLLLDNPSAIRFINDHMQAGIYDMIADRLATEKIFGKHLGLSDLEAYKAVGDAMQEEGLFNKPAADATSSKGTTNQGSQDSKGSNDKDSEEKRNKRRKAASPTKGSVAAGKTVPNFEKMTDEQIEKFDITSLP